MGTVVAGLEGGGGCLERGRRRVMVVEVRCSEAGC